jgi:hypothetical protein
MTRGCRQDYIFIQGSQQVYTLWLPLADCGVEEGGLGVYRSSHRAGVREYKVAMGG